MAAICPGSNWRRGLWLALALLTRIGPHSAYVTTILGPIIVAGLGFGLCFSTAFNTGTYGVRPQDTGVASASVNRLAGSMSRSAITPTTG